MTDDHTIKAVARAIYNREFEGGFDNLNPKGAEVAFYSYVARAAIRAMLAAGAKE